MVTTRSGAHKSASFGVEASPLLNGNGNGKKRGTGLFDGYSEVDGAGDIIETNGQGHDAKRQKVAEPVDKTRWRMKADGGRHTWHYLDDDEAVEKWPQSYADKWYLGLDLVRLVCFPFSSFVSSSCADHISPSRASLRYQNPIPPSTLSRMA